MPEPLITSVKNITPFIGILKNAYSDIKGEFDDWFQIGVSNYIEDRHEKISSTNTFICRSEKVNFYDVYFPLILENSHNKISSDNLFSELFKKNNCATILGTAGSGKTMLLKHAFLQCYKELHEIPIFIELRDLNSLKISLIDYIYSIILKNNIKSSTKFVERTLTKGGFVFFFDGFDEVALDIKEKIVLEIEQISDQYNKNKFLLSSRPGANAESLPRFNCFFVKPLVYNQIIEFIKKQLFKTEDIELINKLTSSIDLNNKDYVEYLTNPLLLSMYIITYKSYPELPKSKNKFYWNVFDTLCTKHDSVSKKGAYIHPKKSKLQSEDFEIILKWFCYISLLENRFNFDEQYLSEKLSYIKNTLKLDYDIKDVIYDLSVSISILLEDGIEYKFPHRTMQDYFMVLFIKDQNENAKKLIYTEKFQKVYPVPHSKSLFDLCIELDKDAYFKYYLLPLFENFFALCNSSNTITNITLYLKSFDAHIYIKKENAKVEMSIPFRTVNPMVDVASLYNIEIPEIFAIKYEGNEETGSIVNKILNDNRIEIQKELIKDYNLITVKLESLPIEILEEISQTYFDTKTFEIFIDNMKTQFAKLKEEYENDQNAKKALIDFEFTK